ncbi:TPA: YhgE/Pip domain-containing protein [Bacillus pseudomycoides]|nr:YhgE/Pip domain-containing protein [Bacillus pseudomycoides]
MRGWKLLGKEFATIIRSKKILIPIIAVLFIPVLYAGMFLWAFWDPYKQLDDLPVAVVNLDEGVVYNGKPIEAGKELVKNLKEKDGFKWEFVSEKTAKKGMDDRKYYMTIRIPSDFSKNTTTLLDANPKKSKLDYIPNESLNFLSSQIGGSAIEKIKGEVSASVTKTYAETMFDSLKDVSKGFADASDGAGKIYDGTGRLKDGSQRITDGLGELSGKANDGLNKLATGSNQITNGLGELNSKVSSMPGGVNQLLSGSQRITAGLGQYVDPKGEVQTNLGKLLYGSQQVTGVLGKLTSGSQQITGGLGQLVDPKGEFQMGLNTLSGGSKQLVNGLGQLQGGQEKLAAGAIEVQKGIQGTNDGLKKSLTGVTDMQSKLPELTKGSEKISDGANDLSQGVSQWKEQADKLSTDADTTAGGAKAVADGLAALNGKLKDLPEEEKQQLQQLIAVSQKVAKGTSEVAQGVQGLAGKEGAEKIQAGAQKVADGAENLHKGQVLLQDGVGSLKDGQQQLVKGTNKLVEGQQTFVANFQNFGDKFKKATTGVSTISDGLGQLSTKTTAGLGQLSVGANQVADVLVKVENGSGQVTGGLGQLVNSKGKFQSGLNQLAGGSGQITGGLNELASGAGPLANGVNALFDGSQQITGGLGQFVDPKGDFRSGLVRLQDGSGQVTNGLGEANDGLKELATKLGEGAEKTSETKGDENKYDMFASPVKVKTEKVSEVPNYGTGFTPYFLSLGLFVGALLLSIVFPLRETVGVPKSGFSWFISKFGVLLAVGVIQALVADAVLLLWLGVEVQSVPYFILFSIITSLSFIALVQFLVTAFGDAGRFVAILTLILQLTTSAGTFPLELIPKPLQIFNAWFPMTYSVSGFKAVVSSGDFSFMWQNAGILMIFIVLLSLGTIGTLTWMHKRQYGKFTEEE